MVVSPVTSAGPATKITSSATDSKENAVWSRADPPSRWDQRARTIEPSEVAAPPTTTPEANSVHMGAPYWAQSIIVTSAAPCRTTNGMSTLDWPNLSTSRPDSGAATA